MTDLTAERPQRSLGDRISAWIRRRQQEMSGRLHASGDKFAAEAGWTVTSSTGRLGFAARTYWDPRFGDPAAMARAAARHDCVAAGCGRRAHG